MSAHGDRIAALAKELLDGGLAPAKVASALASECIAVFVRSCVPDMQGDEQRATFLLLMTGSFDSLAPVLRQLNKNDGVIEALRRAMKNTFGGD